MVCALVFGVSLPVRAEDDVRKDVYFYSGDSTYWENSPIYLTDVLLNPLDTVVMGITSAGSVPLKYPEDITFYVGYAVKNSDNSLLVQRGESTVIKITNTTLDLRLTPSGTSDVYHLGAPSSFRVRIDYINGENESYSLEELGGSFTYNQYKLSLNIPISGVDYDIVKVTVYCYYFSYDIPGYSNSMEYYPKLQYGNADMSVTQETESKEAGLLGGLLEWVKNIYTYVEESWRVVSAGFANIGTWFAELPGKIWGMFEDGLKGLFVPSEESMTEMSDKWDELLSDRFGAVYQVCNIVTESWGGIMNADETNTITVPEVSIPLPGGSDFAFGGQDVKIVPDGFDWLATSVKMVVGMVCTYTFINGMLRRYDELMGVET